MRIRLVLLLSLVAACDDSSSEPSVNADVDAGTDASQDATTDVPPEPACMPDEDAYNAGIATLVATHCGTCHGATPAFGTPYSLASYADWTATFAAESVAQRAVLRMSAGEMPPPYASPAPLSDVEALVAWASCDPDATLPDITPLEVSAPVLQAAAEPPAGATAIDFLAPEWAVEPDIRNLYQCFTFTTENEADLFARRLEFVLDEAAVIHHIVLLRDVENDAPDDPHLCYGMPRGSQYVYAWAPGGGAVDFPDGGLRVRPGERFVLQIHYHNGAGVSDVFDASGVRIWVTPPEGREYGMAALGPLGFSIPGGEHDVVGNCPVSQPTEIYASFPHMHTAGLEFEQTIVREDGTEELLISLSGWSFELQRFYATAATLQAGDRIVTRCRFRNDGTQPILSGEDTENEMCFNFAYMTPPPADRYCDVADEGGEVEYTASPCLGDNAIAEPQTVYVPAQLGTPPEATGGTIADGRYELVEGRLWLSSGTIIGQEVDFDRSHLLVRGQAHFENGRAELNWVSSLFAYFENGTSIDNARMFEFAGPVTIDTEAATGTVAIDCPGESETTFRYTVEGDNFVFFGGSTEAGTQFNVRYVFAPIP